MVSQGVAGRIKCCRMTPPGETTGSSQLVSPTLCLVHLLPLLIDSPFAVTMILAEFCESFQLITEPKSDLGDSQAQCVYSAV